eukprot:2348067-Alexandrium_andersonii.AAC.1
MSCSMTACRTPRLCYASICEELGLVEFGCTGKTPPPKHDTYCVRVRRVPVCTLCIHARASESACVLVPMR